MPTDNQIYQGDIIRCPRCDLKQFQAVKDIGRGDILEASSFKPVDSAPPYLPGDPLICYDCSEDLTTEFGLGVIFRSVERDANSYSPDRSGNGRLV